MKIKTIYDAVRELSNETIAGALGASRFNINLNLAQTWLHDYYLDRFVLNRVVVEAMKPFFRTISIPIVDNIAAFPEQYKYLIEVGIYVATNPASCLENPIIDTAPIVEMLPGEVNTTLYNSIRKPDESTSNYRYRYTNSGLMIYPLNTPGSVLMDYFINPPSGNYAVDYDVVNRTEEFNESGSTDLIWPESENDNFVDIILLMLGIEIRQSEILSWLRFKKQTL